MQCKKWASIVKWPLFASATVWLAVVSMRLVAMCMRGLVFVEVRRVGLWALAATGLLALLYLGLHIAAGTKKRLCVTLAILILAFVPYHCVISHLRFTQEGAYPRVLGRAEYDGEQVVLVDMCWPRQEVLYCRYINPFWCGRLLQYESWDSYYQAVPTPPAAPGPV